MKHEVQDNNNQQHLIEEHSKFVAKAFLYPDLSSSIHYWLMACVEYGTPPNDPMITQICSTTADVDTTTIAATVRLPFHSFFFFTFFVLLSPFTTFFLFLLPQH
ncbi:unnamed protein product [Nippostrongylus brasiliensis]|uniref:Ovule protein n=1 Tax=Nippostrongylus brasiliensis TaxID=27835 RepID=A0A0N4YW07_NIPBR|nr:unnamed protein product [Nippostrongylus brasiliensis]